MVLVDRDVVFIRECHLQLRIALEVTSNFTYAWARFVMPELPTIQIDPTLRL